MSARKLAEALYRKEHPKLFRYAPFERQPELSDLWPCDQQAYVRRVELILAIPSNEGAEK